MKIRPWWDSNPQSPAPEADALSIRPQGLTVHAVKKTTLITPLEITALFALGPKLNQPIKLGTSTNYQAIRGTGAHKGVWIRGGGNCVQVRREVNFATLTGNAVSYS